MCALFEPSTINGMKLTNRFVRSATWEGLATRDGAVTPRLLEVMARLAQGGVGLLITGHAYVRPEGQAGPFQMGAYKDEFVEGLRKLARVVHNHGSRTVLQIAHAGLLAHVELTGQQPLAPSWVEGFVNSPCQVMTVEDIKQVVEAFGRAARLAKEAGFDGVQIHAAHGYLLNQFLSPLFNKRTDAYGGPVENRARALREVVESVRAAVGNDFPVLVKMNCQDFMDGGLTIGDSLQAGAILQDRGIDAIELSGGTGFSGRRVPARMRINSEEKEAYFREEAKSFKDRLHVPLILVGGIRTFHLAEHLVNEGYADYISMSRPLIREPDLVKRWQSGDLRKATCVSDNKCYKPGRSGEGVYCVVEKRQMERGESSLKWRRNSSLSERRGDKDV